MSHTTTTAELLAGLVFTALRADGATGAGQNVFAPRDWPSQPDQLPSIFIDVPSEDKESLGRNGAPQFTVTATIPIVLRVTSKASAGDAGAVAVLAAMAALRRQVEVAVINAAPIMGLLQQYPFVRAQMKVTAEGEQHIGECQMLVGMEFYQGPEDFAQPVTTPLEELAIYTDLVNVFDPSGTYANPPFPDAVKPAPRTSGPDGRAEGAGVVFEIPQ